MRYKTTEAGGKIGTTTVCPLITIAKSKVAYCLEDECEWFDVNNDCCVLHSIVDAVHNVAMSHY